jgi:hypothetical protein
LIDRAIEVSNSFPGMRATSGESERTSHTRPNVPAGEVVYNLVTSTVVIADRELSARTLVSNGQLVGSPYRISLPGAPEPLIDQH